MIVVEVTGRKSDQDVFTFVSSREASVVDYCLVPYETLHYIPQFFL